MSLSPFPAQASPWEQAGVRRCRTPASAPFPFVLSTCTELVLLPSQTCARTVLQETKGDDPLSETAQSSCHLKCDTG